MAWAGSCLRPPTGPPQGPATATIQVTPSNPGEGWEEDPRIAGLKIEEERQPTGEPVQEPGREETSGSTSKALERLHRKIEEKKLQEEGRNVSLWKKVQDEARAFSEGAGVLHRQVYTELLERGGIVLGLKAAMSLVDRTKAEQDTQRSTTDTAAGSERTPPCFLQDQQAVPLRSSPHTGQPSPGRTSENKEPGRPPYPSP